MRRKRPNYFKSRWLKRTIVSLVIVTFALFLYDGLLVNRILQKGDPSHVRIGYVNLHSAKVTREDLKKLAQYDCDLWLFLEWNGNNFDDYTEFEDNYEKYEVQNKNTFGLCILSKSSDIAVEQINNDKSYVCNYPQYLVKYAPDLQVYFVHAPPPVPTCAMETAAYLSEFTAELLNTENTVANIIVGDLNTLPFQKAILKLEDAGYIDVARALNTFPQGTFGGFSNLPKLLKLDYIFSKGNVEPKSVARFTLSSSDHSGLIADFKL